MTPPYSIFAAVTVAVVGVFLPMVKVSFTTIFSYVSVSGMVIRTM